MKRYDLMHNINARGTFLVSKECIPYLKNSNHAHILNISPMLNMDKRWFEPNVAYTIAKYGMSMCVLGMAEEFRGDRIAVNALWPRTTIHTAAVEMLAGSDSYPYSRNVEMMADAAYEILCRDPQTTTGNFFIDDDVLKSIGITDLSPYACIPANSDRLMSAAFMDNSKEFPNYQARSGSEIGKMFTKIQKSLSAELVADTNGSFQFVVTGNEAGLWYLDLKTGTGKCGRGECSEQPDVTLTMDSKDFLNMFTGKLNATSAFMTGKLTIIDDLKTAMKLDKLIVKLKSKL